MKRLRSFSLPAAWLVCAALLRGAGPAPARSSVVLGEQRVGTQVSTRSGNERRFVLEYDDRGRGPRLTSMMTLDAAGLPVQVEITGHDYLKSRVRERFWFRDGWAAWNNRDETGERQRTRNAFYVSMNGVPGEIGVLAEALLAAPQGRLPLLPEGEAHIERVGEMTVENGAEARTLAQYAIRGLDFAATPVWLDEDHTLFAAVGEQLSIIREGWEPSLPRLRRAQEAAAAARALKAAETLAHRPRGALVIQGARLFEAETGATRPNMTVVIAGNRIVAVGQDGQVPLPGDAEFIQANGKTLIPGLWDMHAHLNEMDGVLDLAAGVTSTRDLGNDSDKLLALRLKFEQGRAVGPRIVAAGLIDAPGPNAGPTKVFASSEAEARAAVDRYASLGYEQIKVYSSIKPELLPKIIDEAHRKGLPVGGHVPAFVSAEQAVRLGMNELTHINYLFLNFMTDLVPDIRQPARFTAVAQHAAEIDLDSQRVRDFIALLKQRKVVVDPTLAIFEALLTDRRGSISRGFAPVADRLPPQVRRGVLVSGLPVPEGMDQRYRDSFRAMLKLVGMLHRAGVQVVPGTDSLAGFPLQRELELYVEAGIPAPEVLQLATLGAARVMKHDRELGSVAPGKLADLALVDGDPAANISDIRRVVTTVKDGVVYQAASLYQSIGVRP